MGVVTRFASAVSDTLGKDSWMISTLRPTYETLLDVVSLGRGTEWPVNGEPLRIDPRMRQFVSRSVEPELFAFLRSAVRPGEQILDVGSFLGVYAILMARWASPSGKVHAFEPTPAIAATAARHLRLNGVEHAVALHPIALGQSDGEVTLHTHSEPYRNAVGVTDPKGEGTGAVKVPMRSLDSFCAQHHLSPGLIRMDVQGLEHGILAGARELIARGRGHLRIVVEVHPQLWPMHGVDDAGFDALLRELGLRARSLSGADGYCPDDHVVLEYI